MWWQNGGLEEMSIDNRIAELKAKKVPQKAHNTSQQSVASRRAWSPIQSLSLASPLGGASKRKKKAFGTMSWMASLPPLPSPFPSPSPAHEKVKGFSMTTNGGFSFPKLLSPSKKARGEKRRSSRPGTSAGAPSGPAGALADMSNQMRNSAGTAALTARARDWISCKKDNVLGRNRVAKFNQASGQSGKRAQSAPHLLGSEKHLRHFDHFPLQGSEKISSMSWAIKSEKLSTKTSVALEKEISDLRNALNLPKDVMSQAFDLFQKHAEKRPDEKSEKTADSSLLKERWLTKEGFAKVWHEMTCSDVELVELDCDDVNNVPRHILGEAFRHAGQFDADFRGLDFAQFATWFSSRCFCEEVSLDKEGRNMRRIARKVGMHHSEVDTYKKIFDRFDSDGSGTIDGKEFDALLCACTKVPSSIGLPAARVSHLWKIADEDGDHEIDFEEFIAFYAKYLGTDSRGFEDFYRIGAHPALTA